MIDYTQTPEFARLFLRKRSRAGGHSRHALYHGLCERTGWRDALGERKRGNKTNNIFSSDSNIALHFVRFRQFVRRVLASIPN